MYRKLKRTWSNGYGNYIPKMREVFPELNKLSSEEMCDRWKDLDIEFYTTKETYVSPWIRITLPFALITELLMLIVLPIHYIITGNWRYCLTDKNRIYNWFKALNLA